MVLLDGRHGNTRDSELASNADAVFQVSVVVQAIERVGTWCARSLLCRRGGVRVGVGLPIGGSAGISIEKCARRAVGGGTLVCGISVLVWLVVSNMAAV